MVDLSAFDSQYEAAKPPENNFANLPDGRYQATIEKLELSEAKSGNPMFKFTFNIAAGEHAGRKLFKNSVVTNATLDFVKKDFSLLGHDGKLSDLQNPEVRMRFIDMMVEVYQKTKGEDDQGRPNVNVYINKRVNFDGSAASGPAVSAGGDKPPF